MSEQDGDGAGPADDPGAAAVDLEHAAEGVRDVLGYGVVAISRLRDTGEYEYVAVVGPPDAREYLLGTHLAGDQMRRSREAARADGEVDGRVHYVPRGGRGDIGPRWGSDAPPTDDPQVWHPDDELYVLMVDRAGEVCGHVAVDAPPDGRVPTREQRRSLQAYVDRIVPGVLHADAHRRIGDQVRIAAQARSVVRRAIARLDESGLFDACAADLADCLRADQVWFHTAGADGVLRHPAPADPLDPADAEVPPHLVRLLWRMARDAWRTQGAVVVEHERVLPEGAGSEGWPEVLEVLRERRLESLLMVPVGAGTDCLGMVAAVRDQGADEWTDLEVVTAQDLGRDLGSALQTARFFERERGHAAYKQQLIATIAHELKNPLTAVRGNLELLVDELAGHQAGATMLAHRIERATERLSVLVGNLLTLSEVDDTRRGGRRRPVDLGRLVADAVEVLGDQASARDVEVRTRLAPHARVDGIAGELEHLVVNLVSNAVKYSEAGGCVDVVVEGGAEVVLRVADAGIGIDASEVGRIFGEFFRSASPEARRRPGTGLGLAIAARVVERHAGTIEVDSTLGVGTTFVVRLPAAAPPDPTEHDPTGQGTTDRSFG